ncbi:MAG TPA: hypothetical protein VFW83_08545 [Bryobacteraceae bacterium]|nr:hypothetical protein [Bryobacteraceae bacterium]
MTTRLKNMNRAALLPLAGMLVAGSSWAASPAEDWDFRGEASQLLMEVRSLTGSLNQHAAALESYTRSLASWESQAVQLNRTRAHINAIGNWLNRLREIRDAIHPWQQRALDAFAPAAARAASSTEAAIGHVNEHRRYLFAPVYTDHLKSIAFEADRMNKSIGLHLDLAKAQDRVEELREKVEASRS